jgi:hypothetical protein
MYAAEILTLIYEFNRNENKVIAKYGKHKEMDCGVLTFYSDKSWVFFSSPTANSHCRRV